MRAVLFTGRAEVERNLVRLARACVREEQKPLAVNVTRDEHGREAYGAQDAFAQAVADDAEVLEVLAEPGLLNKKTDWSPVHEPASLLEVFQSSGLDTESLNFAVGRLQVHLGQYVPFFNYDQRAKAETLVRQLLQSLIKALNLPLAQ